MDKKTIVAAISDPNLVRRAFKALGQDPGMLEPLFEGETRVLGQEMTYRIYHHGSDYVIASDCGSVSPFSAVVASIGRVSKYIGQAGLLDSHFDISCLAVVVSDRMTDYCASNYPIVEEKLQPDGTWTSVKMYDATGWFSLALGQDVESLEEVIQDMEVHLSGN